MSHQKLGTINAASFVISLFSILVGIAIAALGIWDVIPTANGLLWRALGTCGVLFIGSVFSSLAIRCFKAND